MIIEYNRPENLEQARRLLNRNTPVTIPLGGGTIVSRHTEQSIAVVDLQALGLNNISFEEDRCKIGAMVRLQDLVDHSEIPTGLAQAARRETNINLRRVATIGGVLMTSDGSSPLLGCLLALNARLFWESGNKPIPLQEWLINGRTKSPGKLITGIDFEMPVETGYDDISRSPEDKPVVYVIYAKRKESGIRVVYGGSGDLPVLLEDEPRNIVSEILGKISRSDSKEETGFSEYQRSAIKVLIDRLVPGFGDGSGKDVR